MSSTGMPRADAADDFLRARRRHAMARLGRRMSGSLDVGAILPFDEVIAALGRTGERDVGVEVIDLDTIVGSVDRASGGFDRKFRPTTPAVRTRWERIALMMRKGEALPPISVYRVGEVHFVRDGHHRVSVARALGLANIQAHVVVVRTRVGASKALTIADLPHKTHERMFRERVPLPAEQTEEVALSNPEDYSVLAEGIEAWAFRVMQSEAHPPEQLDRAAAALLWLTREFRPVVEMMRAADLVGDGSAADAYLRVACERYSLAFTHDWTPELMERVRAARSR